MAHYELTLRWLASETPELGRFSSLFAEAARILGGKMATLAGAPKLSSLDARGVGIELERQVRASIRRLGDLGASTASPDAARRRTPVPLGLQVALPDGTRLRLRALAHPQLADDRVIVASTDYEKLSVDAERGASLSFERWVALLRGLVDAAPPAIGAIESLENVDRLTPFDVRGAALRSGWSGATRALDRVHPFTSVAEDPELLAWVGPLRLDDWVRRPTPAGSVREKVLVEGGYRDGEEADRAAFAVASQAAGFTWIQ